MQQDLTAEEIGKKIYILRGHRVMLDSDLATLYQVETKNLNKAVQRNIQRFPIDFMFQLTSDELEILRFQSGTSSCAQYGGRRYLPYVFTEHGVAMLASVLSSKQAIEANIAIIRAFVKLRSSLEIQIDLAKKIDLLEVKYLKHYKQLRAVFDAIRLLMEDITTSTRKEIKGLSNK